MYCGLHQHIRYLFGSGVGGRAWLLASTRLFQPCWQGAPATQGSQQGERCISCAYICLVRSVCCNGSNLCCPLQRAVQPLHCCGLQWPCDQNRCLRFTWDVCMRPCADPGSKTQLLTVTLVVKGCSSICASLYCTCACVLL